MLKDIQSEIQSAFPDVDRTLDEMSSLTTDVLVTTGISKVGDIPIILNEDAKSILGEVEDKLEEEARLNLSEPLKNLIEDKEKEKAQEQLCES